MKVLKFGGTSVGTPERMHSIAEIIQHTAPQVVVLSAVSGTTNSLLEISGLLMQQKNELALEKIQALYEKYQAFVEKLYPNAEGLLQGQAIIEEVFSLLRSFSQQVCGIKEEKIIVAQGELLSTRMFHAYLTAIGREAVLLPALSFMRLDKDGEPQMDFIEYALQAEMKAYKSEGTFITQGFICRNAQNEIDNLKRGGSDYTASLIGAALRAEEVQIWTDIDGMHNNDPRVVGKTFRIAELSFDEAAELAYFGAKILHPATIHPAKKYNIPVRVLNTMQPEAEGTLISNKSIEKDIKAVAAKDGIMAINIASSRMLLAYGFLRRVFEVFEKYKTPIDMITTSEVAVSLTIDDASHLPEITKELQDFGSVRIDDQLSIVCIVGNFAADRPGAALEVFEALRDVPVRMISYGGSEHNVSVLVETRYKVATLKALNEHIFHLVSPS